MLPFMGAELLTGDKVILDSPKRDDVAEFTRWSEDMGYQRLLRRSMVSPPSYEGMMSWYESWGRDESSVPFAIRLKTDRRLVGMLMIKDVFWQARHASFFIGIGDEEDRGKGYGTDAVRVMLRYAFMEMNLACMRLEVMQYNDAAIASYTRAGFKPDGVLRAFVYRDGVYYDIQLMSILREEWEALPAERR